MSIDANVAYVELKEDGSGTLHLCDRLRSSCSRGQSRLYWRNADSLNPGMWCGPYNPRDYPTHWMPLPAPPSSASGDENMPENATSAPSRAALDT